MIKKLILASALAGSMLVGVPAASASPQMCFNDYNRAVGNCGNSNGCQFAAELALQDCLQKLAVIHQ